jgi:hypothetical protein
MKRKAGLMLAATILSVSSMDCAYLENFFAPLGDSSSLTGTITVTFYNDTDYSVTTYWGIYNPLDLTTNSGAAELTVDSGEESDALSITCTRDLDVAGSDLQYVVKEADLGDSDDDDEDFDYTDINLTIPFTDEDGETVGTADAAQFHIGVDYDCGDEIEIHFQQTDDLVFSVKVVVVTDEE